MSSTSPNVPAPSHGPNGKFAAGNSLGRGNPMGRAVQLFRTQIIRELKRKKAVPALVEQLQHMALAGRRRTRYRHKVLDAEGKVIRTEWRTAWEPVEDRVQLSAIQELLSRAVGKATEFKVIEDNRPTTSGPTIDLAKLAAFFVATQMPPERWPPQVAEYHRRQVAARVVGQAGGPTE